MQFGNTGFCPPLAGPALALADEELGFDIRYFGDNSCFAADPFAELRDAARATTRIRLAVGAANFVTRHPSVIANLALGLQAVSGGRAICGVAAGDSALGVIGRGPLRMAEFADGARSLRDYLRGITVKAGTWDSRIEWLNDVDAPPVPVEMMCSGPKSIRLAGQIADRVTLAVGAGSDRISWALDQLDAGLADAGRSRADVTIGAYVAIAVNDDRGAAIESLRVRTKGIAHMASFPGADLDAQPERLRRVTSKLRTGYDYRHHNQRPDNPLAQLIDADFADWFGIGGPPGYVADRIGQLKAAGIGYIFSGSLVDAAERERFAAEVIPQFR